LTPFINEGGINIKKKPSKRKKIQGRTMHAVVGGAFPGSAGRTIPSPTEGSEENQEVPTSETRDLLTRDRRRKNGEFERVRRGWEINFQQSHHRKRSGSRAEKGRVKRGAPAFNRPKTPARRPNLTRAKGEGRGEQYRKKRNIMRTSFQLKNDRQNRNVKRDADKLDGLQGEGESHGNILH